MVTSIIFDVDANLLDSRLRGNDVKALWSNEEGHVFSVKLGMTGGWLGMTGGVGKETVSEVLLQLLVIR